MWCPLFKRRQYEQYLQKHATHLRVKYFLSTICLYKVIFFCFLELCGMQSYCFVFLLPFWWSPIIYDVRWFVIQYLLLLCMLFSVSMHGCFVQKKTKEIALLLTNQKIKTEYPTLSSVYRIFFCHLEGIIK